jgi:AraC-like DNA-binding protein
MPTLAEKITSTPEGMRAWQQERVIFEITERVCELMEQQPAITRAELARRLGKSPAHVTQLLGGSANMTIRTVSDLFLALGRAVTISDIPVDKSLEQPTVSLYSATPLPQQQPRIQFNLNPYLSVVE